MASMDELTTRKHLDQRGWSRGHIRQAEADGKLVRIRPGLWVEPQEGSRRDTHRALLRAVLERSHPDYAASHISAALLWGLPLQGDASHVWITRDGRGHGRVRSNVHQVRAPLAPDEVTTLEGLRCTTLARTVVDVARDRDFIEAVMVADAALHAGLDPEELQRVLARMRRWPGVDAARRVIGFADKRAESPYESWTRVLLDRMGLPTPELQHEVFNAHGELVARLDFALLEIKLGIEYDGHGKYDELARADLSPGQVFAKEKNRDRELVALGWQMLHLDRDDVHSWPRFKHVVQTAVDAARTRAPGQTP